MFKFRKFLSMFLVVAIFASMCAVSFGQIGGAATTDSSVVPKVDAVYNFKNDKTGVSAYDNYSSYITTGNYVSGTGTSTKSYLSADGLRFYVPASGNEISYGTSIERDMAIIADPDAITSDSTGAFVAKANSVYYVTVKYKVIAIGNTSGVRVGFTVAGSSDVNYGYTNESMLDATKTSNSTDFETFTYVFDSDTLVADNNGGAATPIAGRKIGLIAMQMAKKRTTVLFESVSVSVISKNELNGDRIYNFVDDATGESCFDNNPTYVDNYVKYDTFVDKTNKSYVTTNGLNLYTLVTGANKEYNNSRLREMAVIADPDIATTSSDGAFVAKANKKYTLTVKYMVNNYGGDLNGLRVGFAVVGSSNNKAGYIEESFISSPIIKNMTDYATFTLSLDADTLVADNIGGAATTIAGRKFAVIARQASFWESRVTIQSVTIVETDKTTNVAETYVCNFINDSTKESAYASDTDLVTNYIDYNTANTSNKSYLDSEGLHFRVNEFSNNNIFDKCLERDRVLLYDTDVRNDDFSNFLIAQPGKIYTLSIKYRIDNYGADISGVSVGFGICGTTNDDYVYTDRNLVNYDSANSLSGHKVNKERFETLTKVIDADTLVPDVSGTSAIAGRKIAVVMRQASARACQMTIESVTVKVVDKSELRYINLKVGETTFSTVQGTVGETVKLDTPTNEGYIFAGWTTNKTYADCGNRYGDSYTYSSATPVNNHTFTNNDAKVGSESTATTYYALWAKETVEFALGTAIDGKYLLNDTAATITTPQTNGAWIEQENGEYVLRYSYSDNNEHYAYTNATTLKLTHNNDIHLREGVTYKFSLDLKQESGRVMAIALSRGCDGANSNYRKVVGLSDNATGGFTQIFWRAANTVNDWTTYSVTFTADKLFDTTKAPDGLLRDVLTLRFLKGAGYIKNIKLEAISYTPEVTTNINHTDGGNVKVDYANNKVIIDINDNYTLSSDDVYLTYNYHTAEGDIWNENYQLAELTGADLRLTFDAKNSTNKRFIYSFDSLFKNLHATTPDGICVNVNFKSENTKNAIRYETTVDNEYISAGLRFRYRMDYATTQKATDIGFILLPQQLITSENWYEIQANGKPMHKSAQIAYVKGGNLAKEIWYASDMSTYKDYQLICTGLTRKGVAGNLLNTPFTAIMFAKVDGKYVYYPAGTESYTTISNKYTYAGQQGLGSLQTGTLTLTATDLAKYQIVLPQYNVSYLVVKEAEALRDTIKMMTGANLPIVRDNATTTSYEIVIDNCTNRKGVPAVDEYDKYQIKCRDSKVFICGGRNYSTVSGIKAFVEMLGANGDMIIENVIGQYNASQTEYKLKWTDEFEGTDYNRGWLTRSGLDEGLGGWYGRDVFRSNSKENLYASDGKLHHAATYDDEHFYGTYMTSSSTIRFTYGFTEISAKIADGESLWHCFWIWDAGIDNPDEILEFDVMECWSQSQLYGNVIHEKLGDYQNDALGNNNMHSYVTIDGAYKNDDSSFWAGPKQNRNPGRLMSETFHTFALLWDEEKANFYRDGICTLSYTYAGTATEKLYKNPHYIILSMATGSNIYGYPDDLPDTNKVFATNKKPILGADYWTNGNNEFVIEYVQLFQKDGWYLK